MTRQAYSQRKSQRPLPPSFPVTLTSFVGRAQELGNIRELLRNTRLLTLSGAGGSGKTRLALQLAKDLLAADFYRDGGCWVELAPLSDPALTPQAIIQALGLTEQPSRAPSDTLLDYLRDKKFLLVLDNCEHLIGACAGLAQLLLKKCPDLQILATSREALDIEGEQVWLVPSLALPTHTTPDSIRQSDAGRLFIERATAIRSDFQVDSENAASIAHICWRLDGVPLALELAAARVGVLSAEQIAARLDDTLRLLTKGRRTAVPRHQTLRATMDWSYALLSGPEQNLFRRLAVFSGGFTMDAAGAICAGNGVVAEEVLDLLARLVSKSLVIKQDHEGAARYRQLEPVRQYAGEKLRDAGESEAVRDRHLDFFMQLAELAEPQLIGAEQMTWLRRLDAEQDNLRAAIARAGAEGAEEQGLRMVNALQWFWFWRGYWREAKDSLAYLLTRSAVEPGELQLVRRRARAFFLEAFLTNELVDGSTIADPLLDQAISLGRSVEDEQTVADAIFLRAVIASGRGDHRVARAHMEESLARARTIGDQHLTARVLMQRGYSLWLGGEVKSARADVEEALQLYRALGDRIGKTQCLSELGIIAFNEGDYPAARRLNQESLAMAREFGLKREMAIALQRLGHTLTAEGDYATAQMLYEQNLAVLRELGLGTRGTTLPHMLNLLSNLKRLTGDFVTARSLAKDSLQMAGELGEPLHEAHALASLGKLALAESDWVTARTFFHESLLIRQQISNKLDMPIALQDLADLAFCQSDLELARDYYKQLLLVSRELTSQTGSSVALRMLGYIALYESDFNSALQQFVEGLSLNQQKNFRLGMIRFLPAFAALAIAQGDAPRAARLLAATDALLEAKGVRLEPADATAYRRTLSAVRSQLDEATYQQARAGASNITLEGAVEYALAGSNLSPEATRDLDGPSVSARTAKETYDGLTAREREIAALIAAGKTNHAIAEQLVLSARTVENHVSHILSKLALHSRTQIATWALDSGLVKK